MKSLSACLEFMSSKERATYIVLLLSRSLSSLLDLLAILFIGFFATSLALFISLGSDPNRFINFAGLQFPAVNIQTAPIIALVILSTFVLKSLLSILLTRKTANLLAQIEAKASLRIAEITLSSDFAKRGSYSLQDIIFSIQTGSNNAFNGLLNQFANAVSEGFLFIIIIGTFFFVSPPVAVSTLAYFAIIGALIHFFIGGKLQARSRKIAETSIEINRYILDLSSVLKEAQILSKRGYFLNRIYETRKNLSSSVADQIVLNGMPRYVIESSLIVALTGAVLSQSANGDLATSAGIIAVFLSGGLRLTASMLPLQSAILSFKQNLPSSNVALKIIDEHREHLEDEEPSAHGDNLNSAVEVEFRNVHFAYGKEQPPLIKELSFKIGAGEFVTIIGPSGSGKSTVADLMLGLLDPSSGDVLTNATKPKFLALKNPGIFGYVPQKPGFVDGTIAENIALGLPKSMLNKAKLEDAIRRANLQKTLEKLKKGSDTYLGKYQDELSGGEIQRIGLARALYGNPSLIILDEATSALDAESEKEIFDAIDELRGDVTIVMIAHRLSTLEKSDRVLLIENGGLAAAGDFGELIKKNSTVQKFFALMQPKTSNEELSLD